MYLRYSLSFCFFGLPLVVAFFYGSVESLCLCSVDRLSLHTGQLDNYFDDVFHWSFSLSIGFNSNVTTPVCALTICVSAVLTTALVVVVKVLSVEKVFEEDAFTSTPVADVVVFV